VGTRLTQVETKVTYNLRFPGQYYQAETGVNQNYFRDYDPTVGRYAESDPIGQKGGVNTYAYVRGNPLLLIDPFGLTGATGSWSVGATGSWIPLYPYDPSYAPSGSNCSQYPSGLLHDICTGTPNNPSMNCSRKCIASFYPGQWGGPAQDYVFYFIPQHPVCWWECGLTPVSFCPKFK